MSVSNAFLVSGLDLDLAVLLAEASLAAYSDTTAKTWATTYDDNNRGVTTAVA